MNETITLILSSGVVSLVVALAAYFRFLGIYKEKIDNNEKAIDKVSNKIDKINDKIEVLTSRIASLEGGLDRDRAISDYFKSKSPISLTDKAKAVLLDSGGKDYIDSKKGDFLKEIKSEKPKTAYDIQELAKKVIEKRTGHDEFNTIKEYAFNNALKLDLLLEIFGIYLRDIALSELGFKVEDIKD